jgi:pSer/pThr/pTyr-binding forkhead associated (FHA) protein
VSKLVIFRGDAVETEMHLGGNTVRIGRENRNDIVLDDKSVSRFHAEVRAEGATFFIVDLKSRNGVWMNGHQIKGKAALALGVPVTVGAYELALEDDLSTDMGGESPLLSHTVVNSRSVDQSDLPSRSATQRWSTESPTQSPTQSPAAARKRQVLLWSGAAVATLLICGVTYAVIRYMVRPTPVEVVANPPLAPPQPPVQPPVVDPTKETIDRHLADARAAIEGRDYVTALRDHLSPVLDLDPGNQEALELKRQADEGMALPPRSTTVPSRPEPPAEVETAGIGRRTGEAWADYTARVARIKANFQEGNRSLERKDFANAISRFETVDRDQKDYQGVDSLITQTTAKQRQAVEEAIDNGQQNERSGKLPEAVRWYQEALRFDSTSTTARDKIAALTERLTKEGLDAFTRAEVFRKRNDDARAIEYYKQAVDLLPSSNEKRREAQQWLEKLKP